VEADVLNETKRGLSCVSQTMCGVRVAPRAPSWRRMSISQGMIRPLQPASTPPPSSVHMCGISPRQSEGRPIHLYANSLAHKAHASPQESHELALLSLSQLTQMCVLGFQRISYLNFSVLLSGLSALDGTSTP
jgi:hypothetical protein